VKYVLLSCLVLYGCAGARHDSSSNRILVCETKCVGECENRCTLNYVLDEAKKKVEVTP